ncbi:hypothetical protein BDR03DRAFT_984300 [Suillus americanus]|nr:hypothetical protein BDR03DRAFT_984300 [Suillus americanus]
MEWFPMGSTMLWFCNANPMLAGDDVGSIVGPLKIQVPVTVIQWTKLPDTLKYTQERGFDVRPGDVVCNMKLDSFDNIIGQEVFIVGGDQKGYQATLYSIASDTYTVAVHGQAHTTLACEDIVTSYGMRLNGAILERPALVSFCEIQKRLYITTMQPQSITPPPVQLLASSSTSTDSSLLLWTFWTANPESTAHHKSSSIIPSSSTYEPWIFNPQDAQDNIDAKADTLSNSGPLPWLMGKEYSSMLLLHHAVLKVTVGFMGACPDPFCGANGPAPKDCVTVFCTSSNAGAMLQHYHIPTKDLSPAPPHKQNQQVLVLKGDSRSHIFSVTACNVKKNTIEITILPMTNIILHFDQICLVEQAQNMM